MNSSDTPLIQWELITSHISIWSALYQLKEQSDCSHIQNHCEWIKIIWLHWSMQNYTPAVERKKEQCKTFCCKIYINKTKSTCSCWTKAHRRRIHKSHNYKWTHLIVYLLNVIYLPHFTIQSRHKSLPTFRFHIPIYLMIQSFGVK